MVVAVLGSNAAASADFSPPWRTLSSGGAIPVPGGGRTGAVILASHAALSRYEPVALEVGHVGCCDWQQSFDWKHDLVLLIVARGQAAFPDVVAVHRDGKLLRVTIAAPAGATVVGPTWTALCLPCQLLGQPLPRRIEVATAQAG